MGALKCVLSNNGLDLNSKKCLYGGVNLPTGVEWGRDQGYGKC